MKCPQCLNEVEVFDETYETIRYICPGCNIIIGIKPFNHDFETERLAVTRGGTVHILSDKSPSEKDPWERAICGTPGDFNEYHHGDWSLITCEECLKKRKG